MDGGHCWNAPREHFGTITFLDQTEWPEDMDFYLNMFADDAKEVESEQDCIYFIIRGPRQTPKLVWYMADEIQFEPM